MTNEEAYKWIYVHFAPCGDETKQDEAISIALKAIAKQIPKKPNMPLDAYWVCPTCGKKVDHPFEYCRGCGQKICWEDE